jgi:magnesium and cobalt transporter
MESRDLEEGGESSFWTSISRFFRNRDLPLEESILAARDDGELKSEDVSMLLKVLRLDQRNVSERMVPRTDIVCAELDDGIELVAELIITHGHSRIPIYKGDRDHIVGIVHAKDLLKALLHHEDQMSVQQIMRQPLFIPETKNMKEMLLLFQGSKNHLAIAIDEYGGTSGLITLEDVLEEIVGDIEDEYDSLRPDEIQVVGENDYLVSGRMPLDDLKDRLGLDLDSDQVETIGGYLGILAGRVPDPGDRFEMQGHRFLVEEADAKQILWVHIRRVQDEA